jgi:tRNA(fMet)-specific endonuclease VapC
MPKYILDTDTCIYWLKGDRRIEKKILTAGLENVLITVITECELFYGAYKSARVDKNIEVLKTLRGKIRTIQTSVDVAPLYGRIKADLEQRGQTLDDADLLIAAITLACKGTLITNNTSHFNRIVDLQIGNWI